MYIGMNSAIWHDIQSKTNESECRADGGLSSEMDSLPLIQTQSFT